MNKNIIYKKINAHELRKNKKTEKKKEERHFNLDESIFYILVSAMAPAEMMVNVRYVPNRPTTPTPPPPYLSYSLVVST